MKVKVKRKTFNKINDMVGEANLTIKKARVLQEELTSGFFLKVELKSHSEVNRYWYVQEYNRGAMHMHMLADYLEELERTIKKLNNVISKESERIREESNAQKVRHKEMEENEPDPQ